MTGDEEIQIEKTVYNGEPAAYVKWGDKVLGYLSAELYKDLAIDTQTPDMKRNC